MRRFVLFGVAAVACAVAVFAGRASSAQAFIPSPGPDPGVAGGGYTLVGPDVEPNRVRFEFALRQSQVDGSIRGKSLTMRASGEFTCALDAFCGTKYVSRSWTPTPYPGIPAPFGGGPGAYVIGCSLYVGSISGLTGSFTGLANVFLVDPGGGEHFTGITFYYILEISVGPDASPLGDGITVTSFDAPLPLPMPLPAGSLAKGNVGTTDGVQSPSCSF